MFTNTQIIIKRISLTNAMTHADGTFPDADYITLDYKQLIVGKIGNIGRINTRRRM